MSDVGQLIDTLYRFGFNLTISPRPGEGDVGDHAAPSISIEGKFQSIEDEATTDDVFSLLRLTLIELADELQRFEDE